MSKEEEKKTKPDEFVRVEIVAPTVKIGMGTHLKGGRLYVKKAIADKLEKDGKAVKVY